MSQKLPVHKDRDWPIEFHSSPVAEKKFNTVPVLFLFLAEGAQVFSASELIVFPWS